MVGWTTRRILVAENVPCPVWFVVCVCVYVVVTVSAYEVMARCKTYGRADDAKNLAGLRLSQRKNRVGDVRRL